MKLKRKHYLEDEKVLKHIEKVAGKQKESEWIRFATKSQMNLELNLKSKFKGKLIKT